MVLYGDNVEMQDPRVVSDYHSLTNHAPSEPFHARQDSRLVGDFQPMDPRRRPPPFKAYPDLQPESVPAELDQVLFFSAGVVRFVDDPVGRTYFRAAGSAGNLHPLELYVLHNGALFHYEPLPHAVTRLGVTPDGPTTVVVTGVPWRTAWKYGERGWRHLYWDAGTMLAQLLALAPQARVLLGFVDDDVTRLVGADGVHEFALAVVVLGDGVPQLTSADEAPAGVLADRPLEFPLITAAQRAGALSSAEEVLSWRATGEPAAQPADVTLGHSVTDAIRRRGSTRRFQTGVSGPAALLDEAFARATTPLPADFLAAGETLLEHNVLVHAVDGQAAGAYRWTGDGFRRLRQLGHTRALGRHLCLDQELGGSGCCTAFHCTDLSRVLSRLSARGYRCALLEAGVVAGRLQLAAFALGYGGTGLTFYDTKVPEAFDTRAEPMLVTALGKPATRAKPAGEPGRPTRM